MNVFMINPPRIVIPNITSKPITSVFLLPKGILIIFHFIAYEISIGQ